MATRVTENPVYRRIFLQLLLAAYKTVPGGALIGAGPKIRLIKQEGFALNPDLLQAAFTAVEADFSGYAPAAVTFAGPTNPSDDAVALIANDIYIGNTDDPFIPNTIWGYWVNNEVANDWVMAEMFAPGQEVTIAGPGDYLDLLAVLCQRTWQAPA